MDWVRGIIGVEAMVRHGKKLSEGKEKEGEGEGRCISPVQPDPFSLGLWYDSFRGGDYVYLSMYKCTRSFSNSCIKTNTQN